MPEQTRLPLEFVSLEVLTVEEIWNGADIAALLKLREDRRIERKPAGVHGAELAEYLSMWDTARKILERLTTKKKVLKHIHRTDLVRDPKAHFVLADPEKTISSVKE